MTTTPIFLLAPAGNMTFSGMPSGATYVSNQYGIITITNGSVADQQALIEAGCVTLEPNAGGVITVQTGTSYVVQTSDQNNGIFFNSSSSITATLPNSMPVGFGVTLYQGGSGQVTASAASGAGVVTPNVSATYSQYSTLFCVVISNTLGTNAAWDVIASPPATGGGLIGAASLSALYSQDTSSHYAQYSVAQVFADSTSSNDGYWLKTGTGNGSGNWTQQSTPSPASLQSQINSVVGQATTQGTYPATAGTGTVGSSYTYLDGTSISGNGTLTAVSVYSGNSNTIPATIVIVSISSGNATSQASINVMLSSGANTFTGLGIAVQSGWYIGVYSLLGALEYSSGGTCYSCSGQIGSSTAVSSASFTMAMGWVVESGVIGEQNRAQYQEALLAGESFTQGIYPATSGSGTVTAGDTAISVTPISETGILTTVSIYSAATVAATLVVVSISGSTATLQAQESVSLTAGANTLSNLSIPVQAGWYVGMYSATAVTEYSTGGNFYYCSGLVGSSTSLSTSSAKLQLGWVVVTGDLGVQAYAAGLNASATSQLSAISGSSVMQGVTSPAMGSAGASHGDTWFGSTPISQAGTLEQVQFYSRNAGQVVLVVGSLSGSTSGGTMTLQAAQIVNVTASTVNTITNFNPVVQAGWYVGIFSNINAIPDYFSSTGNVLPSCTGLVSSSGTTLNSVDNNLQLEMNWTVNTGTLGETTRAEGAEATNAGSSVTQGQNPPVVGTSQASSGLTCFSDQQVLQNGFLTSLSVYHPTGGPATLVVASFNAAGTTATLQAFQSVYLQSGLNTFPNWNPYVQQGWYVGVYCAGAGPSLHSSTGDLVYSCTGLVSASGTSLNSASSSTLLEIGWTLSSGIVATQSVFPQLNQIAQTGVGLLEGADPTGTNSSQQQFLDAQNVHGAPVIPQGTFTVSSLLVDAWGLWTPSPYQTAVSNNGVTMSLPVAPRRTARWLDARARLVSQIYSGSCLIFNGDSITHGAFATGIEQTFASLATRFLNNGIALDEPVLANFDNSDAAGNLAFNGLSLSSPSTVTNGTNGPVSKSLMLQASQVLTFTGAYADIDVTYTGVSGGQLKFAYNGTSYATINCASTGSDVYSGPTATGQTASGTYTITNTGSVAVEITSLIRLGVLSGSIPRLYVCRFAHGGYLFTSYGSSQIASMYRIASVFGGSNHFLIPFLGTNDEVGSGLSYSTLKSNVTTFVSAWTTAGVSISNILPMMPWRWGVPSYYPSGASFEQGNAAIRDAYVAAGISQFIKSDGLDLLGFGALGTLVGSDNHHPNTSGHKLLFDCVIDALAA